MPGECVQSNVVYQVDVKGNGKIMSYCGSTVDFKKRYSQHKASFNEVPKQHTTLSSYIWKLKNENIPYDIKWSVKTKGHPFSSGSNSCDLCLSEKVTILMANQSSMLNKRDEILETCRRRRKHILASLKQQSIENK